jgi:hypothetical protein
VSRVIHSESKRLPETPPPRLQNVSTPRAVPSVRATESLRPVPPDSDACSVASSVGLGGLRVLVSLLPPLPSLPSANRMCVAADEGIDAITPAGKLQMHVLGAIAEFERGRIRERVLAGLQRARTQGKRLGRPKARVPIERLQTVAGLAADVAAERLGVSRSTVKRWRNQIAIRATR